ncbi:MAG TPA: hypothetical protein VII47_05645, partial [Actinomycetota bacterium]
GRHASIIRRRRRGTQGRRSHRSRVTADAVDDGIGPPPADAPRGRGLDNMAARAAGRSGSFDIRDATGTGTHVESRVPHTTPG